MTRIRTPSSTLVIHLPVAAVPFDLIRKFLDQKLAAAAIAGST